MDDLENLEEIPETEELADTENSGLPDGTARDSSPRNDPKTQHVVEAMANPGIPMFILNDKLYIVYISEPARTLLGEYYKLDYGPFFNILNSDSVRSNFHEILSSLNSKEHGFTWKGILPHKAPDKRTLQTKITFFPIFGRTPLGEQKADFFIVFFEKTENAQNFNPSKLILSLLKAVELKDNDTGSHNKRVGYYSRKIAQALYEIHSYPQVDPDFIDNITLFATMHDVGKIGTPDSILLKPGKLSSMEWDIMKEHTINGAFILSGYPVPMAKEIALSHHEWWNGSGYPYKLAGEMIPLSARIVAIADVYDAIRMRRSYKESCTHQDAVKIIESHSSTHFDPFLVAVFTSINWEFDSIWNEHKDDEDTDILAEIQNDARTISLHRDENFLPTSKN